MGVPHLDSGPMRAEEFFAFTATRPDDEKWELIEGEPVLNASASFLHQIIASNLIVSLGRFARETDAIWAVVPGIGVRISPMSVPVPDVLVRPQTATGIECDDMLIAIEVLSPSTADYDLRWKRKAYASLPSLLQYVVIAQDALEVVSFDRANEFSERRFETAESVLDLPVIGACMNLREIYRGTRSALAPACASGVEPVTVPPASELGTAHESPRRRHPQIRRPRSARQGD